MTFSIGFLLGCLFMGIVKDIENYIETQKLQKYLDKHTHISPEDSAFLRSFNIRKFKYCGGLKEHLLICSIKSDLAPREGN